MQRSGFWVVIFASFFLTNFSPFSPLFSQTLQLPAPQSALEQRFAHALRHLGASRYDSATVILEQIVSERPDFQAAYRKLSEAYIFADKIELAREKFTRMLQKTPENAYIYYLLARLDFQQKRYDAALEKLQICIGMAPDFEDAYSTTGGLPEVFHAKDDIDGGIRFFKELIAQHPDHAFAYYGLGRLSFFKSNWEEAERWLQKSTSLKPAQEAAYITLQNIYDYLGDYKKSIRNSQKLLKAAYQMNSLEMAANALIRQGGIKFRLGIYRSALEDLLNGIALCRQIGVKKLEAIAMINAGAVHATLGNYPKALGYFQQALELTRLMNARRSEMIVIRNIGLLNKDTGNHAEALEYLEAALKLSGGDAYIFERGNTLIGLAETMEALNRYKVAIQYYKKALDIFEQLGSKTEQAYVLTRLGDQYFKSEDYQKALEHYQEALQLSSKNNDAQTLWESRAGLGATYEKLGRTALAVQNYQLAIASYDSIRQNLDIETLTQSFLDDKYQVYPSLVHLMAESQQYAEAFRYVELYKAKNLLRILSKGQVVFNELLPDTVKFELISLRDRIADVRNRYAKELEKPRDQQDAEQLLLLDQKITELELKKSALLRMIREQYPQFHQLTSAEPVTIPQLQERVLQPGQLLLEYLVGPEQTYLFAIAADTLVYRTIALHRDSLVAMISAMSHLFYVQGRENLPGQIIGPDQADFSIPPAYRLAQSLLEPVQHLLERYEELLIVPDDILYYIPFEALVTDTSATLGRYDFANATFLVEEKPVSYSPSASVLTTRFERSAKPGKGILALGDPEFVSKKNGGDEAAGLRGSLMPLPHSREEVEAVGRLLSAAGSEVLTGRKATESAFYRNAGDYQIIHVASHFVMNDQDPLYSRLALSEEPQDNNDGLLYTYEIFGLKLNADLVTLSACNTALGKLSKGEGLIGISRALLTAGAPSMVVSLWSVDDAATSRIMEKFYANLAAGMPKNRALQQAKIDYIQTVEDTHKDPFYWAPFVLIGDLQPISLPEPGSGFANYTTLALAFLVLLGGFWVVRWRRERVRVPSSN